MVSYPEFIIRILLAAALGGIVGFERERQHQPTGLRTLMILTIGSALAMMLSTSVAFQFHTLGMNADPAHIAAQVISGVGFLGAGAILHYGINVKGLTTATSLWTMAIIGLTVGAGYYFFSAVTTLLVLVILVVLNIIEKRFIRVYSDLTLIVAAVDRPGIIDEIRHLLAGRGNTVSVSSVKKSLKDNTITLNFSLRTLKGDALDDLVGQLSSIQGLFEFTVE
jgi:putative Mg2+ transporter-C (MgtC) family protein